MDDYKNVGAFSLIEQVDIPIPPSHDKIHLTSQK